MSWQVIFQLPSGQVAPMVRFVATFAAEMSSDPAVEQVAIGHVSQSFVFLDLYISTHNF